MKRTTAVRKDLCQGWDHCPEIEKFITALRAVNKATGRLPTSIVMGEDFNAQEVRELRRELRKLGWKVRVKQQGKATD